MFWYLGVIFLQKIDNLVLSVFIGYEIKDFADKEIEREF